MIDIYDVAKKANVSIATVSRVINNKVVVSQKKKDLVLSVIEELGYVPSYAAKNMRIESSGYIGLLLPSITVPFYPYLIKSIDDYINEFNYSLVISSTDFEPGKIKKQLDIFKSKKIDGIIYDGLGTEKEEKILEDFLNKTHIPVVFLENYIDNVKSSYIINDNYYGAYEATKYLAGLGHKKIAVINTKPNLYQDKERFNGYVNALKDSIIEFDNSLIFTTDEVNISDGYKACDALISSKNRPTAIFCLSDVLAFGALKCLYEKKVKVPDEISVLGYDDIEFSSICYPPLTTVHQRKKKMGLSAAKVLMKNIELIRNHVKEIRTKIVLKPYLVIRESTGPCRDL